MPQTSLTCSFVHAYFLRVFCAGLRWVRTARRISGRSFAALYIVTLNRMKLFARSVLCLGLMVGLVDGIARERKWIGGANGGAAKTTDAARAAEIANAAATVEMAVLDRVDVLNDRADASAAEVKAGFAELVDAMNRGSPDAMIGGANLIIAHGSKLGYTRDDAEDLVQSAAVLGSSEAAAKLGKLHRDATGVEGSSAELAWKRVAALLGRPFHQYWYGYALHPSGRVPRERNAEARGWMVLGQRGPLDTEDRADFAKAAAAWTVAQRREAEAMADQLERESAAFQAKFRPVPWKELTSKLVDARLEVLFVEHARFKRELDAARYAAGLASANGGEPELLPEQETLLAEQMERARAKGGDTETFALGARPIQRRHMAAQTVCLRTRTAAWPAFQLADLTRDGHREDRFSRLRRALAAAVAACDAHEKVHRNFRGDLEAMVATRRFTQPGIEAEFIAQLALASKMERLDVQNRALRDIFAATAKMYERAAVAQEPERVIAQEWPGLKKRIYAAELQRTLLNER